jgi:predicted amidohydrolase YtcJ
MTASLILVNCRFATLDRSNPNPEAVAIADGKFLAVGSERDVRALADAKTEVIDLRGRRVIPGLIDSHMHVIRGGLNYNMELRWDGVRSLADAMRMLKEQVDRTPAPQWVRVVGGFTEHQFAEKRLPTLDELNAVAPATPVFVLHLYDRALLNGAALRVVGYTKDTPNPPGGETVRDQHGNPTGLLLAQPNASILYATLAKGPKLPPDYQKNSTRHFMREVNRLGVTGVIDAGGGFQNYPEDYRIIEELHAAGELTVRIAYNLFTQKPKEELGDFRSWSGQVKPGQGDDLYRHNGAGEMLVYSAADFEDFRVARPDMPPSMEGDLEPVVRLLAENRWPWRLHATYNETITRPSMCSRRSTRTSRSRDCTGSSTTARPFPITTSTALPHSAAALPCSTAWPIRANISSSATAPKLPSVRLRSGVCWRPECRSARAPMRPASPPTTPGFRCPGS